MEGANRLSAECGDEHDKHKSTEVAECRAYRPLIKLLPHRAAYAKSVAPTLPKI